MTREGTRVVSSSHPEAKRALFAATGTGQIHRVLPDGFEAGVSKGGMLNTIGRWGEARKAYGTEVKSKGPQGRLTENPTIFPSRM